MEPKSHCHSGTRVPREASAGPAFTGHYVGASGETEDSDATEKGHCAHLENKWAIFALERPAKTS